MQYDDKDWGALVGYMGAIAVLMELLKENKVIQSMDLTHHSQKIDSEFNDLFDRVMDEHDF